MTGLCFPWQGRIVVIAPECMGFRSLAAMAFLSLFLILWCRPSLLRSILLAAIGAAIAIVGNLLRIAFLLGIMWLSKSDQLYFACHDYAGFTLILIEAILLGKICDRLCRKSTPDK